MTVAEGTIGVGVWNGVGRCDVCVGVTWEWLYPRQAVSVVGKALVELGRLQTMSCVDITQPL